MYAFPHGNFTLFWLVELAWYVRHTTARYKCPSQQLYAIPSIV